jgi:hypothetical protein
MEEYREEVTEVAVERLCGDDDGPSPRNVRAGMQVVFATVTDAIIHSKPGPMRAGSARMVDCLSDMFIGYLDLPGSARIDSDEDNDETLEEVPGTEEPPELGPDETAIYDFETGRYHGKVRAVTTAGRRTTSLKKGAIHSEVPKPRSSNHAGADKSTLAAKQVKPTADSDEPQPKTRKKRIQLL